MTSIPVFFHTPKGEDIESRPHNVITEPQHAGDVTRAFFNGDQRSMSTAWPHVDDNTKKVFAELKINPNDCVNGEISAHQSALTEHAPDLLLG